MGQERKKERGQCANDNNKNSICRVKVGKKRCGTGEEADVQFIVFNSGEREREEEGGAGGSLFWLLLLDGFANASEGKEST